VAVCSSTSVIPDGVEYGTEPVGVLEATHPDELKTRHKPITAPRATRAHSIDLIWLLHSTSMSLALDQEIRIWRGNPVGSRSPAAGGDPHRLLNREAHTCNRVADGGYVHTCLQATIPTT
jgi:hypothetical protein